jgi:integrase
VHSLNVKVYELQRRDDRARGKPYRVRWVVDGQRFEQSYVSKALADKSRAGLLSAVASGQPFDLDTGLPVEHLRARDRTTWYDHARSYVDMKWPAMAAKSRRSAVEALTTVTPALVSSQRGAPTAAILRRALYRWAFNPNARARPLAAEEKAALDWLVRASVPVARVAESDVIRAALVACSLRLDGKPAAATVVQRKRAVLYNALGYAVERGLLDYNPIDRVQWKAPAAAEQVDRRVVANTAQVERLLAALPTVGRQGEHLVAFFGCLYYAGMRPSEAARLHEHDCVLPVRGWGAVVLAESAPHAGSDWTDDGAAREVRGLKHRGAKTTRPVPIPPELVDLLRAHLDRFGAGPDGRLFRAPRGGHLSESSYSQIWKAARETVLTPAQVASPLVGRPYDLRHAAVSLWLNCGVPATEVAYRAGHGVAVLLKVYAGCIDGDAAVINERIGQALGESRERGRIGGASG